jgi:hypothetical protein
MYWIKTIFRYSFVFLLIVALLCSWSCTTSEYSSEGDSVLANGELPGYRGSDQGVVITQGNSLSTTDTSENNELGKLALKYTDEKELSGQEIAVPQTAMEELSGFFKRRVQMCTDGEAGRNLSLQEKLEIDKRTVRMSFRLSSFLTRTTIDLPKGARSISPLEASRLVEYASSRAANICEQLNQQKP